MRAYMHQRAEPGRTGPLTFHRTYHGVDAYTYAPRERVEMALASTKPADNTPSKWGKRRTMHERTDVPCTIENGLAWYMTVPAAHIKPRRQEACSTMGQREIVGLNAIVRERGGNHYYWKVRCSCGHLGSVSVHDWAAKRHPCCASCAQVRKRITIPKPSERAYID